MSTFKIIFSLMTDALFWLSKLNVKQKKNSKFTHPCEYFGIKLGILLVKSKTSVQMIHHIIEFENPLFSSFICDLSKCMVRMISFSRSFSEILSLSSGNIRSALNLAWTRNCVMRFFNSQSFFFLLSSYLNLSLSFLPFPFHYWRHFGFQQCHRIFN